ncbi:MAG: TAXI family TRAP transporter solute-binding subunit [Planctomycetota bacterium]
MKSARSLWIIVFAAPVLAAGLWWGLRESGFPETVRIASGAAGGTWDALANGLAEVLREEFPGVGVDAMRTAGSVENVALLERGEADLAFVQNDTPGSADIRVIAPLYDEVLQIVVSEKAEPRIADVADLRGHDVAIGPAGSGTSAVARRVFSHFGLGDVKEHSLDLNVAVAAFREGEIDVIFVLSSLPSAAVSSLVRDGQARLLALGDFDREGSAIDGLCVDNPYFNRAVIPARSYGLRPAEPVGTVSVTALLVARAGLDAGFAREVSRLLFQNKARLAQSHVVAARLSETFEGSRIRFPLHEGAASWYRREDPSFFVRYAELMSLVFTLLVAGGSAGLATRQWIRQRKKNRIDVYYVEIEDVAGLVPSATRDELLELRRRLDDVRRRAFSDLVRERLLADDSFRIFQTFLHTEVETIHGRVQELTTAEGLRGPERS